MELLGDWAHFQRCFHAVKRAGPGYGSNLYAPREQIDGWIAQGRLMYMAADDAALFLLRDRDFQHLFHVAGTPAALAAALAALSAVLPAGDALTADLVGPSAALAPWTAAYRDAGFSPHRQLRRMARAGAQALDEAGRDGVLDCDREGGALAATPADAAPVLAMLERLLDRYSEQLPGLDELERAAADGKLLLARHQGALAGMLMFDLKGRSAQLRFWHLEPGVRGIGIGAGLIRRFFALCRDTARIVLWVVSDNAAAIGIYRHYGFEMEDLLDQIMLKPASGALAHPPPQPSAPRLP